MSLQTPVRFRLKNVCKRYKSHKIGPVNLEIFENEVLGLIGKTGCGKTTIANVIMRLTGFDTGVLIYKGCPIKLIPIKEFRRQNQIMFQNHLLSVNPLLNIEKIVTEPLIIEKYSKIRIKERVEELLEMFELSNDILEKYPDEVSGGELQRLVFLRAITFKPEFIILDEPFSNLNRSMVIRLIESIKKIRKTYNFGILIITHSPEYSDLFSDRKLNFAELLQPEFL